MNPSPIHFLASIAGAVVLLGVLLWFGRRRRELEPEAPALAPGETRSIPMVLTPDGEVRPRCSIPECSLPANRGAYRFARSEGLGDFVRRLFGAPPRFRVRENRFVLRYCDSHGALACELARAKLAAREQQRVESQRDAELELVHFELEGLDAQLCELVTRERDRARRESQASR